MTHNKSNSDIVNFSRDQLFAAVCTIDPKAVRLWHQDVLRYQGQYMIPGPNYLWSLDGYDKLKAYEIQVYACIDAHSWYIIWIYIEISNCTSISVLRQYLNILKTENIQLQILCTDQGSETVLMANAHIQLIQKKFPAIILDNCYQYGTSTANQRIETWWRQLTKSSLFKWRVSVKLYFLKIHINK